MSISASSVGINIPQVLVAGIEDAALSKGNMKNAALMAGAVGLSNLVPSYATGMWGSSTEKYIAEPIVAGILYALGTKFITSSGEKESSLIKKFAKGFIIGASSAGVAGAGLGSTMAKARVPSQYSSKSPGLRSSNLPASQEAYSPLVVS